MEAVPGTKVSEEEKMEKGEEEDEEVGEETE